MILARACVLVTGVRYNIESLICACGMRCLAHRQLLDFKVELEHQFARPAATEAPDMESLLEVGVDSEGEVDAGAAALKCHRRDTEYGNWMNGACGGSDTLALNADDCHDALGHGIIKTLQAMATHWRVRVVASKYCYGPSL